MKKKNILLFVILFIISFHNISLSQDLTPEQIYEKINDAVVVVNSYDENNNLITQGSGFFIEKNILVTNYHVLTSQGIVKVIHKGNEINNIEIIGIDVINDISILKSPVENENILIVGNSDELKIGQKIYAIGSPKGFENSFSEGMISGRNRAIDFFYYDMIQITANISHGSSGGAIVNTKGEVIGISSFGYLIDNLFFAIPINLIKNVKRENYNKSHYLAFRKFYNAIYYSFYTKQLNTAIDYLTDYLNLFPKDEIGNYLLGYNYYKDEKLDFAGKYFIKCLEINPNIKWQYYDLKSGNIYNKFADSLYNITLIIKKDTNNSNLYFERGNIYLKIHCFERSIEDYDKAIFINDKNSDAYIYRGSAYYYLNKFNNSISDWENAIKYNPDLEAKLRKEINKAKSNLKN